MLSLNALYGRVAEVDIKGGALGWLVPKPTSSGNLSQPSGRAIIRREPLCEGNRA